MEIVRYSIYVLFVKQLGLTLLQCMLTLLSQHDMINPATGSVM